MNTSAARLISTLAALGVATTMLTSMTGCLVASSKAHSIHGAYVQPGTVSKVKLNATTRTEVEELMGQPSVTELNDDGSEVWTWNWSKTSDDSGAVFLIFAGSSNKTVSESVHIKFVDSVAVKKWRD